MNLEELKENPVRYIKSFAMDIIVVLVALSYVFYQMITLQFNNVNPLVLLAESAMGIICGVVIKQALGENGFSRGYNSEHWKEEEDKYNSACNIANPYIDRVDNFYLCEEIEKKKNYRRQRLQAVRLKYEDWFDLEGNYCGDEHKYSMLTKRQRREVKKCIKVKIYVLNLFSEYATASEQDTKKELTDKIQRNRNLTKNTISATAIAIIGVYFIPFINEWNWGNLISSTMQVSMWILFGVLQLYSNYNFIVNEKTSILRKKKELIKRFVTGCEQDMYKTNPYDDMLVKHLHDTPNVLS